MKLIYGVFTDRNPAGRALDRLRRELRRSPDESEAEHEIATAAIHEQDIRNEDLPRSGNFAIGSALVGAALVFFGVGLFMTLLMTGVFARLGGPPTILGSAPVDAVLVTLAAAVFGGILAGIAGSAGNRAKVRSLRSELARGRVVLTFEAADSRTRPLIRLLTRSGAVEAGAL